MGKPVGTASDDPYWLQMSSCLRELGDVSQQVKARSRKRAHAAGGSSQSKAAKQSPCAQSPSLAALGLLFLSMLLQPASLFLLGNFFPGRGSGRWPCSPGGEGESSIQATNRSGAGWVPVVFKSV